MAIVGSAVPYRDDSWTANETVDGIEYSVTYKVIVDDPADGPAVVLGAGGLPALYGSYSAGNDANADAKCKSRTPTRLERDGLTWVVDCRFTDELLEEDLSDLLPKLAISTAYDSEPINDAVFIPQDGVSIPGQVGSFGGPIVNSAGVPFDPVPERQVSRFQVRLTRMLSLFDGNHWEDYPNSINNDGFTISGFYNAEYFTYLIAVDTCVLKDITADEHDHRRANGDINKYMRTTWTFDINPGGWRWEENDRGNLQISTDGRGNPISPGDVINGIIDRDKSRTIYGNTTGVDVPFNGAGIPLVHDSEPVVLEFDIHPTKKAHGPIFNGAIP